jgi:CheY-like chemotaxis protein
MGQVVRPVLIALTATPEYLNARESGAKSAFDAIIGKSPDLSSLLSAITLGLASAPDRATRQDATASLVRQEWLDYDAEPCRPGVQGDDPGPPRILVIEDEECERLLLTSVIQHRGYVVETVSNGLEAVRRIRDGCYDLVLVDYNLPEVDGLAIGTLVLDLMREHVRPRLIALTATPARLHDKLMMGGSVFDEVIEKSSDLQDLVCAVDRHLRSSPNPATRRAAALTSPIENAV